MRKYLLLLTIFTLLLPAVASAGNTNPLSIPIPMQDDADTPSLSLQNVNSLTLPSVNRTLVFSGYTLTLPDMFKHTFDSGLSVFLKSTGSSTYQGNGLATLTSSVPFAPAIPTLNRSIPNAALIGIGYKVNPNMELQLIPISIGLLQKDGNTGNSGNSTGTLVGFIYNF